MRYIPKGTSKALSNKEFFALLFLENKTQKKSTIIHVPPAAVMKLKMVSMIFLLPIIPNISKVAKIRNKIAKNMSSPE